MMKENCITYNFESMFENIHVLGITKIRVNYLENAV